MKIIEVTPAGIHPYSGLLVSQIGLARALNAAGHEISHVTLGPLAADAEGVVAPLHAEGVQRHQVGSGGLIPSEGREGAAFIDALAGDIVHLHGAFSPQNNLLARHLRTPYVVSPHGGLTRVARRYRAMRKAVFVAVAERPLLRDARVVRALTPAEAEDLGAIAARITVVPNGVAMPSGALPDRHDARRRLGLPPDRPVALFVGRLDVVYKRLDAAVRALQQVPWSLAMVGPDFRGGRQQLTTLAERLGVSDRLLLCGPRRDLEEAFAACDVFVLLSRSEGLPMALLEALAQGIPAVVSPAVERVVPVATSGAGWVREPEDLGRTLCEVPLDRLSTLYGENARALARTYSWEGAARAFAAALAVSR
jgi:glycosyltransferase involved in cell wall biosynthesis